MAILSCHDSKIEKVPTMTLDPCMIIALLLTLALEIG